MGIIDITGNKKCMGIIDITGNKKCMGFIDITGNKGWVLLISQEIRD